MLIDMQPSHVLDGPVGAPTRIFVVLLAMLVLGAGTTLAAGPQEFAALKAAGGNVYKDKDGSTGVSFQEFKLDDKGWKALESISDLKTVRIGTGRDFGDAQLARLCEIKTIESIFLNAYGGTDSGMTALAKLPNLRHLGADHSPFTGQGLAALKDCKNFRSLRIAGGRMTEEGMKTLGELTQLREVDLGHMQFTSTGFANFAKLVDLEKLTLSPNFYPYFVGADFVHLSALKNLNTLVVGEMPMTYDDGLDHLKKLKLKLVKLQDCRLSDSDLSKFEADHAETKIERTFSIDENFKRWDMELEKRKKTKTK
jgi:hypothetical protein